jgi:hypothetical protein
MPQWSTRPVDVRRVPVVGMSCSKALDIPPPPRIGQLEFASHRRARSGRARPFAIGYSAATECHCGSISPPNLENRNGRPTLRPGHVFLLFAAMWAFPFVRPRCRKRLRGQGLVAHQSADRSLAMWVALIQPRKQWLRNESDYVRGTTTPTPIRDEG